MTTRTRPVSALGEGDVRSLEPAFHVAPVAFLERDPRCGIVVGDGGVADGGFRFRPEDCRRRFRTVRGG